MAQAALTLKLIRTQRQLATDNWQLSTGDACLIKLSETEYLTRPRGLSQSIAAAADAAIDQLLTGRRLRLVRAAHFRCRLEATPPEALRVGN